MPNNPSVMKRQRQADKRRLRNRAAKSAIRTFTKKALQAAESGDIAAAEKFQKVVQGLTDKASKRSNGAGMHPRQAARRKSRLANRIRKAREGQTA